MQKNTKKKILVISTLILILLSILGVVWTVYNFSFNNPNTTIKNGFSNNLKKILNEKYELTIPQDAIFIDGYYENSWQDPAIHITFKMPMDKIEMLFTSNWTVADLTTIGANKDIYETGYQYNKEQFTWLLIEPPKNRYVEIYFQGRHPGNRIK